MTIFGVHIGPQTDDLNGLRALWRRADSLGFGWISVWDHFYAATGSDDPICHEAVACHAALACDTVNATVGCLVYSIGYRHPAVLANAISTIDHLSGGRAAIGLGAGWNTIEYRVYGLDFPPVGKRMDQFEEATFCVRSLLRNERTDFQGEWYQMSNARCEPKPLQAQLPIWVGGAGEKRTLRIAARLADGWNIPFVSPEVFAQKRSVLRRHCDEFGRDPSEIRTAVNVGLAWSEESLQTQFGRIAETVRDGVLIGSVQQVIDKVGSYVEAGADQVNLAMRLPFEPETIDRFAEVMQLSW